jgi:hypothetical protein
MLALAGDVETDVDAFEAAAAAARARDDYAAVLYRFGEPVAGGPPRAVD